MLEPLSFSLVCMCLFLQKKKFPLGSNSYTCLSAFQVVKWKWGGKIILIANKKQNTFIVPNQINFIVIIGILKFCMKFKWEVRWWHGIEFMTSCSNAMLNYQFYSKLKLLGDGNFIHFNLSALDPWGTPAYSKVLSSDKLFDPQLFLLWEWSLFGETHR